VGEQEWLEQGHGNGDALKPMIEGPARDAGERVSNARLSRTSALTATRRGSRRRTRALVGWLLYCCTAVGGTAAAWTVRETLFPSVGAPTARTVWDNPGTDTTPPTPTDAATPSTEVVETALNAATAATTPEPASEEAVNSASGPGGDPTNIIDDHRANAVGGPQTGTTVAGDGRRGEPVTTTTEAGTGLGGEAATTVDDHDPNNSTPASVSNPPASGDPAQTTPSAPGTVTTDTSPGHQSGKVGGSSPTSTP
jgi:hypothetical protein